MGYKKETRKFKTEVQEIMNLIINSIYSNKDIFLRELISNASDAIDKLKFKSETERNILSNDTEFEINLKIDSKNQILEISDNGIGMTYEEVLDNIGTIAKSGTSKFLNTIKKINKDKTIMPKLIGQFGVGFYSSFMVAKKVELITKSINTNSTGVKWTSSGNGEFTIENIDKKTRGTKIIVYLNDKEKNEKDYTNQWVIQNIIKQHSDFVNYPIIMDIEKYEPLPDNELIKDKNGKPIGETTKKIIAKETLNSMKAIWTKTSNEVSKSEYEEFYKHISHDWNPPLEKIHLKFEGTTEYDALLYIPSKAPFDLFNKEKRHGIHLYSKRIFIMEDCKELIPEYFRFIKGVVDARDLNLNISREILQQDRLVINIKKNLLKKIFELLNKMEDDKYKNFYNEFGSVLKEGIHTDTINKNTIAELIRFKTTKSNEEWKSLKNYIKDMQPDQNEIYYLTGENITELLNSPYIEQLKEKNYEVLLMTDPIDEWVVQSLTEYDSKPLKSAEKGDLNLNKINKEKKENYNELFNLIKKHLNKEIKEVKDSTRLSNSISCLSGDTWDMSTYMKKLLKSSGQKINKEKRILELNLTHPVVEKIKKMFDTNKDDPLLKKYIQLIYDIAIINEGGKLKNPNSFSKTISNLLIKN